MDQFYPVNNIFGHIANLSEIIIGVGNYNSVHGIMVNDGQLTNLNDVAPHNVLRFILTYEDNNSFSLSVNNKYLNIDQETSHAIISHDKAVFTVDYSNIDKTPRSYLLAGGLYALKTTIEEKDYLVSWRIKSFADGELIMFLPTTWYTNTEGVCAKHSGVTELIDSLQKPIFKGFTTEKWCETAAHTVYCENNIGCGNCLGQCSNDKQICYPINNKFICGSVEPDMFETSMVTFANSKTNNNNAKMIIIIVVVVVLIILLGGLLYMYRDKF